MTGPPPHGGPGPGAGPDPGTGTGRQPVEAWIALLGSDNVEIRTRAARQLIGRDDTPLDVLVIILEELSDRGLGAGVRRALLGRTDPDLADRMLDCLSSPNESTRVIACDVLGPLGDRRAVGPIIELVDDPSWRVGRAAITALGQLGDASAAPVLRRRFLDVGTDVNLELALHGALTALDALDGLPPPSWSTGPAEPPPTT